MVGHASKKAAANGFSMFMQDTRFRMIQNGERPPPMSEMPLICHQLWDELSSAEKDVYKERANTFKQSTAFKQLKIKARTVPKRPRDYAMEAATMTSPPTGNRHAEMPRRRPVDKDAIVTQMDFVTKRDSDRQLLSAKLGWRTPEADEVRSLEFYIASAQPFYETENREFPPAELALIKCSAKDGILEVLHCYFPLDDLACDMMSKAQNHSTATHELLFEDKENKLTYKRDMQMTLNEILIMRGSPQDDEMPTFCRAQDFQEVLGAFHYIQDKAGDTRKLFTTNKLNCIEDLGLALAHRFEDYRTKIDDVEEQFAKHHYDITAQTNCSFHEARANHNCALGEVRSSYYLLMEQVANVMGIQRVAGTHYPLSLVPVPPHEFTPPVRSAPRMLPNWGTVNPPPSAPEPAALLTFYDYGFNPDGPSTDPRQEVERNAHEASEVSQPRVEEQLGRAERFSTAGSSTAPQSRDPWRYVSPPVPQAGESAAVNGGHLSYAGQSQVSARSISVATVTNSVGQMSVQGAPAELDHNRAILTEYLHRTTDIHRRAREASSGAIPKTPAAIANPISSSGSSTTAGPKLRMPKRLPNGVMIGDRQTPSPSLQPQQHTTSAMSFSAHVGQSRNVPMANGIPNGGSGQWTPPPPVFRTAHIGAEENYFQRR